MFEQDCTVYNKILDKTTRSYEYTRTNIPGVFFDENQGINVQKSGTDSANSVLVVIPDITVAIHKGDYIIKGNIQDNFTILADLQSKYNVYVVTSVDLKDFGNLQHIEVGAK